jgi:hypothetical protein
MLPRWTAWAGLLALVFVPVARADDDDRERVALSFPEDRELRTEARSAPAGRLPDALRLEVDVRAREQAASAAPSSAAVRTRRQGPRPGADAPRPDRPTVDVDALAIDAAIESAARIARTTAWREYYRIGAWDGLRRALRDEGLGRRDFDQGLRRGRRDREARVLGRDVGAAAGERIAGERAEARVEAQFTDLAIEPRFDPRAESPDWTPRRNWAASPELRDVFLDFPVTRVEGVSPRLARVFDGWRFDPFGLSRCASYTEFHDASWKDAARAFRAFEADRRRSHVLHGLSPAERARFRAVFVAELPRQLARRFDRSIAQAWDRGFEDGFAYGAFVQEEWHFRLGYEAGFNEAVARAASAAFDRVFFRSYGEHYGAAFRRWSDNPMPSILGVTLIDGNDDGVFEPGEDVLARYELANFGGVAGRFHARLEGRVLEVPADDPVLLPARRVIEGQTTIGAVISDTAPVRSRSDVRFVLGDQSRSLPLLVSYPLELSGRIEIRGIDALGGRAHVALRVVNRSRRPVTGYVDLDLRESRSVRDSRPLPRLRAGESAGASFDLSGLDTLALLRGGLTLRLAARVGDTVQDARDLVLPSVALDLESRDLLQFMVELARDPRVNRLEIRAARDLLLDRLRVDWRAAVRARGNPYKYDHRHAATTTALGDLVRTWETVGRRAPRPEVFIGLERDVLALAGDLPGAHPLLRKHLRKLARRLS